MKTKLTLKYSSFFFCNSITLKKGEETEIETDELSQKDILILNAYIASGGIESSEGLVPVILEDVVIEEPKAVEEVKEAEVVVEEKTEEVVKEATEEVKEELEEEATVKKTTKRTTKKTK